MWGRETGPASFCYAAGMKTRPAYVVIDMEPGSGGATPLIKRTTTRWPSLEPGEIVVRLRLEIPDALLPRTQEIVVEDVSAIARAVAAEPEGLDPPEA